MQKKAYFLFVVNLITRTKRNVQKWGNCSITHSQTHKPVYVQQQHEDGVVLVEARGQGVHHREELHHPRHCKTEAATRHRRTQARGQRHTCSMLKHTTYRMCCNKRNHRYIFLTPRLSLYICIIWLHLQNAFYYYFFLTINKHSLLQAHFFFGSLF